MHMYGQNIKILSIYILITLVFSPGCDIKHILGIILEIIYNIGKFHFLLRINKERKI